MTVTQEEVEESWDVIREPAIPRLTDSALVDFVLAYCDGKILTSENVRQPDLLPMIFLPIALGGLSGMGERDLKKLGIIWEYYAAAGPRAINGYPTFFSCRLMRIEDWERAVKAIEREMERRESLKKTLLEGI